MSRQTLLKFDVPLSQNSRWYTDLQQAFLSAGIPVNWQSGGFHITAIFMYDDTQKEKLKTLFEHIISHHVAPELTFNKLDAFTGNKSGKHIVNLTATNPSHEFENLINILRTAAIKADALLEDYKLHVTLGRISGKTTSLDTVKNILSSINFEPFPITLKKAIFKYLDGGIIESWEMS
jgi:2'-5' RNA ligase